MEPRSSRYCRSLIRWSPRRRRPWSPSDWSALRAVERLAKAPREVLDELPRGAAGAGAARRRPFQRLGFEFIARRVEAKMLGVAHDHGEIIVLAAMVEAEPEAKPVGERHLLLDRFARIDGASALVFHHLARHKVAPVRGRIEEDVGRPAFDAALECGFKRLIRGVAGVEREIVAEDDEPVGRLT